jgi:ribonuclease P protein component
LKGTQFFGVKRKFRLTRSTDFQRVRRLGKSYAHPLIVLIALPNELDDQSRIGIAAGRSVGNAVRRNRAKRLLRAAIQPYLSSLMSGWDLVLIARRPLAEVKYHQAQNALASLLHRAGLLQETYERNFPHES